MFDLVHKTLYTKLPRCKISCGPHPSLGCVYCLRLSKHVLGTVTIHSEQECRTREGIGRLYMLSLA